MLKDEELRYIADALAVFRRSSSSTIPWNALPPLNALGLRGVRLTVDLRAVQALGAPLLLATSPERRPAFWSRFSGREQAVALCLRRGLSNKSIARELEISVSTVKDHVHRILEKSGSSSRGQLAAKFDADN